MNVVINFLVGRFRVLENCYYSKRKKKEERKKDFGFYYSFKIIMRNNLIFVNIGSKDNLYFIKR